MSIEFAYAQARIQARNGQRLTPGTWQSLEASQELPHYLHALRATSLKPWIIQLTENADAHLIERSLRETWRGQVQQLTTWVPKRWRQALLWLRTLPDLPSVVHLLRDGLVFPWLREDPALQPVAVADADSRWQALSTTELAPLATMRTDNLTPVTAWRAHWRCLWPGVTSQYAGLDKLEQYFNEHIEILQSADPTSAETITLREQLEQRLAKVLRSRQQLPAAVFSYAGLLALDLQRLRGGLARRALFTTAARE